MLIEPRDVESEVIVGSVVVVSKVSEFERLRDEVLDSPLVLEDGSGGLGGGIGVIEISPLVEVDADVERVVAPVKEVDSDLELPEDGDVVIAALEL